MLGRVKKLIDIVEESGIERLEVSYWFWREIKITRYLYKNIPKEKFVRNELVIQENPVPVIPTKKEPLYIKSYMVGTFYRGESEQEEPVVKEGDRVSVGQVIGYIEAMKLRNEVESLYTGIVKKFLVNNAKPVEFGQPLCEIELTNEEKS